MKYDYAITLNKRKQNRDRSMSVLLIMSLMLISVLFAVASTSDYRTEGIIYAR
jgi:hypothetical protein